MPQNIPSDSSQNNATQPSAPLNDPRAAARNNSCPECRAKDLPKCMGHGKCPTGGNDGGLEQTPGVTGSQTPAAEQANAATPAIDSRDLPRELQLNGEPLRPQILSKLLSEKLLTVEYNNATHTLTLKLQHSSQREELDKFAELFLKEWNVFKTENGLADKCAVIDKDSNGNIRSIHITLPTQELFTTFIQKLESKNLLPAQTMNQQEKSANSKAPSMFKPAPASPAQKIAAEEVETNRRNTPRPRHP